MNLKTHLIENPQATFADVVAFEITEDKKKVGSGTARGFFAGNGVWAKLKATRDNYAHPLSSLCDAVLITASDASSYFGLDSNTAEGRANIMGADALVTGGIMTPTQRDDFLQKAIKTTTPFVDTTEDEYNVAKQAASLFGVTESYKTLYNGAQQGHLIFLKNDQLKIEVIYDEPVVVATSVKIFAEAYDMESNIWIRESRPITIFNYSVNERSKEHRHNARYGNRKIRFVAVSDTKLKLSARVTVA